MQQGWGQHIVESLVGAKSNARTSQVGGHRDARLNCDRMARGSGFVHFHAESFIGTVQYFHIVATARVEYALHADRTHAASDVHGASRDCLDRTCKHFRLQKRHGKRGLPNR